MIQRRYNGKQHYVLIFLKKWIDTTIFSTSQGKTHSDSGNPLRGADAAEAWLALTQLENWL